MTQPGLPAVEVEPRGVRSPGRLALKAFGALIAAPLLLWRWLLGAFLCLGLGSVLVVGWTQRATRRVTLRRWQRRIDAVDPSAFAALATTLDDFEGGRWPNWIVEDGAGRALIETLGSPPGLSTVVVRAARLVARSLARNLRIGVQTVLNTWVPTLPGCVLLTFAWYAGWNNSFHKGYELAWIGPTVGGLGIVLFALSMLYVPLAQARQAVTGEWRAFWHFRTNRAWMREKWIASAGLAALYGLAALPLAIASAAPALFGNDPALDGLSDEALAERLLTYWMVSALAFLPLFLGLRLVAARIYASGIERALRRGSVTRAALTSLERSVLDHLVVEGEHRPSAFRRLSSRLGRFFTRALTFGLWLAFALLPLAVQFFNYRPLIGWLNHPLVQLPWLPAIPIGLAH